MALTFPYALDFLANCLTGERIPLTLQRHDEMSGTADGRFWAQRMAGPLWTATYALYSKSAVDAREINAKIHALDGMAKTMLWADPYYAPSSSVGLGGVTISSIRADRGAIALAGLPAGFVLRAGDFFTVTYASGRVYMGAFAEGGTASGSGIIAQRDIYPYLPLNVGNGASVELARPYFKAMVKDYVPFANFRGQWGDSASITILQKI
jgi:hypothetical protein